MRIAIRTTAIVVAATVLGHGAAQGMANGADQAATVDWSMAETAFEDGRANQVKAETKQARSQCAGYWMLHTDAVDDGAFPAEALSIFPEALGRVQSELTTIKYRAAGIDRIVYLDSANWAESQLRLALAGDSAALEAYFTALGGCAVGPTKAWGDSKPSE